MVVSPDYVEANGSGLGCQGAVQHETSARFNAEAGLMSSPGVCVTRGQLHTMKEQSVLMFSRTEAEEEGIINRLMKRLGDLKKEKETLLIEVSRQPWPWTFIVSTFRLLGHHDVWTDMRPSVPPVALAGGEGGGAADQHAAEASHRRAEGEGANHGSILTH